MSGIKPTGRTLAVRVLGATVLPMAHHKRGRPKNRRAGCLLCKPHKANGAPVQQRTPVSALRRMQDDPRTLVD
jgi:hypothetical protein